MAKHYVGEIGTEVYLDTGLDLTNAINVAVKYRKPDAVTNGTWTGEVYSSYSALAQSTGTYYVKKTVASGDFDTSGNWKMQAFVAMTTGTWYGETFDLNIYGAFE